MKYLTHIAAALIVTALTGCIKDKEIGAAESKIRSSMKDPDSTKFESVKNYGNGVVCGKYNSKNSYGAYVGFKGFVVTKQDYLIGTPKLSLEGLNETCTVFSHVEAGSKSEDIEFFTEKCRKNLANIEDYYVNISDYTTINTPMHERQKDLADVIIFSTCGVSTYNLYRAKVEAAEESATKERSVVPLRMIQGDLTKLGKDVG